VNILSVVSSVVETIRDEASQARPFSQVLSTDYNSLNACTDEVQTLLKSISEFRNVFVFGKWSNCVGRLSRWDGLLVSLDS
jgi:phage-related protein